MFMTVATVLGGNVPPCKAAAIFLAALAFSGSSAAAGREVCTPVEEQRMTGLLVTAGGDVALFVASFRAPMTSEQVACFAKRGDKAMVMELGRRHELGEGVAKDAKRAEQLYVSAAASVSGNMAIYVPGVGKSPGRVQMFRTGPDVPGQPLASFRRGLMHVEGRAARPNVKRGLKLIRAAAKAGVGEAVAYVAAMEAKPKA